jgi:hypothetical protein
MLNCDNCTYDLCHVLVCDNEAELIVPATATDSGNYLLVIEYLNTAKVYQTTLTAGSPIVFPMTHLNENYCYTGYIVGPDGLSVPVFDTTTSTAYGNIRFCTHPKYIHT